MDSVDSKLSAYTALSVIIIFVSTTLFICWKLSLGKGKDSVGYFSAELPTQAPRRSVLKQTYPEQWQTDAPSSDAFTESEPLEKVLQDFVENRNKDIEKKINDLRRQESVRQAHRYLDAVCIESPKSSLSQASSLSQQSLYVTSDRTSDPVYNTISKVTVPEQSVRRSQSVSERGVRFSSDNIVPGNFLGAISKREIFRTIREA